MHYAALSLWMMFFLMGCLFPEAKDARGVNSPMLQAYQAAQPSTNPVGFELPMTPESQMYALTGGILILMVFVILKASQSKN